MRQRLLCSAILSATLLFHASILSAAAAPAQLCVAARLKATASEARSKIRCHAAAVRNGVTVDAECLARAQKRFFAALERAESPGGCGSVADAEALDTMVDAFTESVVDALAPAQPSATPSLPPTPTATATPTAATSSSATPVSGIKKVFVTSLLPLANLGGLSGADGFCQDLATAAAVTGTYKAWLSNDTTSAEARFTHSQDGYVLVDGSKVADDWLDLTDGTLMAAIVLDETGTAVPAASAVWTGTHESGGALSPNCRNWTSSAIFDEGVIGSVGVGFTWTRAGTGSCGGPRRLYCIEQ